MTCLTPTSQSAFKRAIEAQSAYRPALVAARPGWLEGFYVFGDGSISAPSADDREVIVTFERNPKFAPRGTLQEWQDATGPFIAGQPLILFVIGLALSGALLHFVPRGYLNPQVEIEGGPETGKSSVGVLAASVWAGNPDSDCGGGESWDMTVNSLDPMKLVHGDGFLFLDEANLAGASAKDRREFARQAAFKVATTGSRRRLGDAVQGEHARLAMLSTTNTPLADLVDGGEGERNAVRSRRITFRIAPDAACGIFATLPSGFENSRAASEAMVEVADRCWGTAGRAFVARLVRALEEDEDGLRALIARALDRYRRRDAIPTGSARAQKTFALVAVAASLARRWDIFHESWGTPMHLVQAVAHASSRAERPEAAPLVALRAYVERNRPALIEIDGLSRPLGRAEFAAAKGFLRQGRMGEELLVSAPQFQAAFPEHEAMMKSLRASGYAQTEGGHKPKLTIKAPRAICVEGRVYCIKLSL